MTHDYQPEWDYNTVRPGRELARLVKEVLNFLKSRGMYRKMGLKRPRIACVRGELGNLAEYVDGTKREPVIILDVKEIEKGASKYDLPLGLVVETTIVHELAHAFEDSTGRNYSEEDAEGFAEKFHHFREIDSRYTVKPPRKRKRSRKHASVALQGVG